MSGKRTVKANLPTKTCLVCQRPFTWRKKWSRVWDEVLYCSDACRGRRQQKSPPVAASPDSG
ncbi:hypothetical protein EV667_3157 [Ancylobacter aquaticus]|uniref:DUF2256 domain-containing protein n=1 Tax=Ancylobacter aquaticus TaxID=100 RepID=A0A4R1I1R5_ANCAQ|nr:DUF2256 domain-containing protein [Ancylobacter aquaticus]TCK29137.1 hypothetical protein EV667_3157 [Ancylobacter aquaticus]